MKLYRGIKKDEFQTLSPATEKRIWQSWETLLERRHAGDFGYPTELTGLVHDLAELQHLTYQHFTDNKAVASSYAKKVTVDSLRSMSR